MRHAIGAAALAVVILGPAGAFAQDVGDPAAGEQVFRQCQACHAVGEGARNGIGPELNGVISEKPGVVEGYNFSPAFQEWAADKEAWTADLMAEWLRAPSDVVPGTRMVYPGLSDEEDLANVIAFLASHDEEGAEQDPATVLEQ